MDTTLYEAINGLAGHNQIADVLFTVLGSYGPFLLALLWFWPGERLVRDRRQQMIIIAVLSVAVALLINQIIIHLWNRPRPFVAHVATLLLPPSNEPSFPSDHATFSFALAIGLLGVAQRVGVLSLPLATLIAFARVYTGEHYVSDVAAGAHWGKRRPPARVGDAVSCAGHRTPRAAGASAASGLDRSCLAQAR